MIRQIRTAAYTAYLATLLVVMGLGCLPVMLFGERATRATVKAWSKIALFGLKYIGGVSMRVEGLEHMPEGGALIASNHQSMWETIAFYALAPNPVIILKKELLRVPIYGWYAAQAGNIAVDRKGGAKALRAMAKDAKTKVGDGAQIIIFPEGTRRKPGERAPFQPGVAGIYLAAGAPCVPAAHDSGVYWRHPAEPLMPGTITLRLSPPIPPGLDRKAFVAELKARIEAARPDLAPQQDVGAANMTPSFAAHE